VTEPTITPLGDTAITVTFGNEIDAELNSRVAAMAERIRAASLPGVSDVVPAYASLGVHYDPVTIGYRDLRSRLIEAIEGSDASAATRESITHVIRVRYNGEDLVEVAKRTGLTTDEVARIHSSGEYRVFVIGFVPGWAYLAPLDKRLVLPRRESPRKRVPAGSVAIAEAQTGIYPLATPGGWHLIGTTDLETFNVDRDPPSLFTVGDRVRFESVE
jgi:inhibitor of KinA